MIPTVCMSPTDCMIHGTWVQIIQSVYKNCAVHFKKYTVYIRKHTEGINATGRVWYELYKMYMQNVHGVHEKSTEVQYLSDPEMKKCKMKNVFEKNGKKKLNTRRLCLAFSFGFFCVFLVGWLGVESPKALRFIGWVVGLGFGCFLCLGFCFCVWVGGWRNRPKPNAARFAHFGTNHRNKGLISVDRRTSLLSHVQYPVPYQSRLQRIYRSQCPKGD
jgi:hypothetical protein